MGLRDSKSVLRSARDEPTPSVQVPMPGDEEHSSMDIQEMKAGHSIEHWLNEVSAAAQERKGAGIVPVAKDTDEVKVVRLESRGGDPLVRLSKEKSVIEALNCAQSKDRMELCGR